jgi:hypothetical protein
VKPLSTIGGRASMEPYVKNFAHNIGHGYGGRVMVAWIDK